MKNKILIENRRIIIAVILALITGQWSYGWLDQMAHIIEQAFMNLFKAISLPIIFLSIMASCTKIQTVAEVKRLGLKVFQLTLLTTSIAACIGLILYLMIQPAAKIPLDAEAGSLVAFSFAPYFAKLIPDNFLQPFLEYNLIAVVLIGFMMGFAAFALPRRQKLILSYFFDSLFNLFLKITEKIIFLIPVAIWAFITSMTKQFALAEQFRLIFAYTACIVLANLIQAVVVLPLLLKSQHISPLTIFRKSLPVLWMALVTKSSSATLPLSIQYAVEHLKLDSKIVKFVLPICTTINMNGCASFILITVLFVANSSGIIFSNLDYLSVLIFAIIAAIGNASVPMGCYFMTTAFLATIGIPLKLMSLILPIYIFLDMLETAINVWSDICVTTVVHHRCQQNVS